MYRKRSPWLQCNSLFTRKEVLLTCFTFSDALWRCVTHGRVLVFSLFLLTLWVRELQLLVHDVDQRTLYTVTKIGHIKVARRANAPALGSSLDLIQDSSLGLSQILTRADSSRVEPHSSLDPTRLEPNATRIESDSTRLESRLDSSRARLDSGLDSSP